MVVHESMADQPLGHATVLAPLRTCIHNMFRTFFANTALILPVLPSSGNPLSSQLKICLGSSVNIFDVAPDAFHHKPYSLDIFVQRHFF